MAGPERRTVRFGVFEIDLHTADLKKHGLRVRLRGKPFEVLAALLERPGDLVTREELQRRLWPSETFVDFEHGLNAAVNKLREALGDSAERPRFVETIPRRGYRFVASLEPEVPAAELCAARPESAGGDALEAAPPDSPKAARWGRRLLLATVLAAGVALVAWSVRHRRPAPPREGLLRLAVLPLRNLSADPGQEYFVDGMTDALTAELAQIRSLRVISRSSVIALQGIAKPLHEAAVELDVDMIVEGSALQAGGRARITLELVDAASDRHLWARSYECDLDDVIDVQRRVALEVAEQVQATLTREEQARLRRSSPVEPRAYEAYLRGRFLREKDTEPALQKAIGYFQQALGVDPGYAPAYAGLADCYRQLGAPGFEYVSPLEAAPKAERAARRALALDPDLPEAKATLAMLAFHHDWDLARAEEELRQVIRDHPSHASAYAWYASVLDASGRFDEAIEQARLALALDPLSERAGQSLGSSLFAAGRPERAVAPFRRTLELEPRSFRARLGLARCLWRLGKLDGALVELDRALKASEGSLYVLAWRGFAYARAGHPEVARAALATHEAEASQRYVPSYHRALLYAGLGEAGPALEWLERSRIERSGWIPSLRIQPEFEALSREPRFVQLLEKTETR